VELSEILQEESLKELGVRINLWAWRHIIIGIAKAHLQEIAPFFDKDEKACKTMLETNTYTMIFPWLAGHQWAINVSVYGLDSAFPGKIQPELLSFYRRISKIWHYWLGISKPEGPLDGLRIIRERKGRLLMDEDEQEEDHLPAEKRPKVINIERPTTPKSGSIWSDDSLDVRPDDSPSTKRMMLTILSPNNVIDCPNHDPYHSDLPVGH
jgi:hypothetical protein